VVALFVFRQLPELVGRIPQDAVKNPAAVVLAVRFAAVRQVNHFFRQLQGLDDVKVAGSHGVSFRRSEVLNVKLPLTNLMPEENRGGGRL
jgi:predicted dinucleotide-binding enzyme